MLQPTTVAVPFLSKDALAHGFTPYRLRRALRDGELRRVLRNVYVQADAPDTVDLRITALHLVMPPHAVIFGTTAMWVLGIDAWQPEERFVPLPTCVVPHGATRTIVTGVKTVEGYVDESDVMDFGGLRITTPVRTTVDALRRLRRPFAMSAADAMAHAGWVTKQQLVERIEELAGFPGVIQARELARIVDPRYAWRGESWVKVRLKDSGLPLPEPQIHVVDVRGREGWVDVGYLEQRAGCEYDGKEVHTLPEDRDHDARRRTWLHEAMDWRIAVTDKADVFAHRLSFELEIAAWLGFPLDRLKPRTW